MLADDGGSKEVWRGSSSPSPPDDGGDMPRLDSRVPNLKGQLGLSDEEAEGRRPLRNMRVLVLPIQFFADSLSCGCAENGRSISTMVNINLIVNNRT